MTLLIDNYDSFTYNLVQMAGEISPDISVLRNDEFALSEIERMSPERIIISPGPGKPRDAGLCEELILRLYQKIPILGICLGHQAICEVLGGKIGYAKQLIHGKADELTLDLSCEIFSGLPEKILGARYHSLAAEDSSLPRELLVTARSGDGEIMAVRHESHRLFGLQFHPESVLTPLGRRILENFIGGGKNDSGCDN